MDLLSLENLPNQMGESDDECVDVAQVIGFALLICQNLNLVSQITSLSLHFNQ